MATLQKEDETSKIIDWVTGGLGSYPLLELKLGPSITTANPPDNIDLAKVRVQQSDLLKPLLMNIAWFCLNYAYKKTLKPKDDHEGYKFTSTKKPKKYYCRGGMAGLLAGYELSKVGHKIEILETQMRLGG